MRFLGGSGDGNNSSLVMPSQAHLRHRLVVLLSDGGQSGIGEKPMTAFRKRCPGFHLHAMLLQGFQRFAFLEKRMGFDLIYCGFHVAARNQVLKLRPFEIAHADGLDSALMIEFLHGLPGAFDIASRPMNQVEVQIIRPQLIEGSLKSLLCRFVPHVGLPQFRGDKEFFTFDSTLFDPGADCRLSAVDHGGVNQTIAQGDGIGHAPDSDVAAKRHGAQSQTWHLHAVIEGHERDQIFPGAGIGRGK